MSCSLECCVAAELCRKSPALCSHCLIPIKGPAATTQRSTLSAVCRMTVCWHLAHRIYKHMKSNSNQLQVISSASNLSGTTHACSSCMACHSQCCCTTGIHHNAACSYEVRSGRRIALTFEQANVSGVRISPGLEALLAPAVLPRGYLQQQLLLAIKEVSRQLRHPRSPLLG